MTLSGQILSTLNYIKENPFSYKLMGNILQINGQEYIIICNIQDAQMR